jgi:hypothetical protein
MADDSEIYPSEIQQRRTVSRRSFLVVAGAATAGGLVATRSPSRLMDLFTGTPEDFATPVVNPQSRNFGIDTYVRRADDMLNLRFEFYNLKLDKSDPQNPKLVPVTAGQPAAVVAVFPPQSLVEQAFFEEVPPTGSSSGDTFKNGGEDPNNPAAPNSSDPPNNSQSEQLPELPVQTRLAGESRLAFVVPADVTSIPYTMASLLSWTGWKPSIVPSASRDGYAPGDTAPAYRPPTATETQIEMPWRLVLSPNEYAGWSHALDPVTHGTPYTELWHTRLGVLKSDKTIDFDPTSQSMSFRAINALDPSFHGSDGTNTASDSATGPYPNGDDPFRTNLSAHDRAAIVAASGDYSASRTRKPLPISEVHNLMLTPLGGYLDSTGRWPVGYPVNVWKHRATLGRDHYTKVVYFGYLMPFGIRAALVKETERKFQFNKSGDTLGAFLRQRFYIYLRKPIRQYGANTPDSFGIDPNLDQRLWPLRLVECTTLVTPDIDPPTKFVSNAETSQDVFLVTLGGGTPLQFHFHGTDWNGDVRSFTSPCVFMIQTNQNGHQVATDPASPVLIAAAKRFNGVDPGTGDTPITTSDSIRNIAFHGQQVSLAKPRDKKPGETASPIRNFVWGVEPPGVTHTATEFQNADQPAFFPIVTQLSLDNAVAQQAHGGDPLPPSAVQFYVGKNPATGDYGNLAPDPSDGGFLQHEFGAANNGEVFLEHLSSLPLGFAADKSGGMMTPNMSLSGISRALGPVAGPLEDLAGGTFNPANIFPKDALDAAKLLGALSLSDIINLIGGGLLDAAGEAKDSVLKILQTQVHSLDPTTGQPQLALPPVAVDINVDWKPELKQDPLKIFRPHDDGSAELTALLHTDLVAPSKSTYDIEGTIQNFDAVLFGDAFPCISITFNKLGFVAKKGQKTDFSVDIGQVQFLGVLKFVEQLEDLLKSTGSGLSIDLTPTQITAGLTLQIPSFGVGVFSLQNMSFSSELDIPFTGDPARARFAFCSRENPFLVTVYIFGGGGFFSIALGLDGLEIMEAQLEFGAAASIDLGVASGGVHIMAGIYFKMQKASSITPPISNLPANAADAFDVELTGFLDIGGSVEAFGILTVSIDCYLAFTYDSLENKVSGQATLTISVSVFCFSASASFTIERHFGGTDSDPGFADQIPSQTVWNNYASAFAPIGG